MAAPDGNFPDGFDWIGQMDFEADVVPDVVPDVAPEGDQPQVKLR